MDLTAKPEALGLELPSVSMPGGNYTSVNIRGKIGWVAIQFPILNGIYLYQGKLGENITTEDGYKAMQLCALNVLAHLNSKTVIKNILGINHADIYYVANDKWDEAPIVANGASDLFVNILEEKRHPYTCNNRRKTIAKKFLHRHYSFIYFIISSYAFRSFFFNLLRNSGVKPK